MYGKLRQARSKHNAKFTQIKLANYATVSFAAPTAVVPGLIRFLSAAWSARD